MREIEERHFEVKPPDAVRLELAKPTKTDQSLTLTGVARNAACSPLNSP